MNLLNQSIPQPSQGGSRRMDLDAVRGLALFGILIVNIQFFGMPFYWAFADTHPFTGWAYDVSRAWVALFFEGKFITLFSFLFGLGFALFAASVRRDGAKAGPLFLRRVFLLALFGAVHAFFIWAGDVLLIYAFLAVVMLLFLNRKPTTLLVWGSIFVVLQFCLLLLIVVFIKLGMQVPEAREQIEASFAAQSLEMEALAERAVAAFQGTDRAAMFTVRMDELVFAYQGLIFGGVGLGYLMAVFLLGLYAGKKEWFTNVSGSLPVWRKRIRWMLPTGLGGALTNYWIMREADIFMPDYWMLLYSAIFVLSTPLLTASYVILLLAGLQRWPQLPVWPPLASSGRMSLSVYLSQSLLFTTVFYGYGLGLYAKISLPYLLLMAVAGHIVLVLLAHAWMQRFNFGPMEYLWRSLIYGRFPVMRKPGPTDRPDPA